MRRIWQTAAGFWLWAAAIASASAPDFERDVAPILVAHCLDCHQPAKKSGELVVATLADLQRGGEQGPVLDADAPTKSLLLARVTSREMPPPDEKEAHPLTDAQIATLRAWIESGAAWPEGRELGLHEKSVDLEAGRKFWSFQPVVRPPVPNLGNVGDSLRESPDGIDNPIDAFILAGLEREGLTFRPPAAPHELLRRLSLDLRGFPPTVEELAASNVGNGPDDWRVAHSVDRFLADPAYGERWARHWLDLVRYADSNGYERDGPKPSIWRYRDWVIESLNSDKPFDQFAMEQIAADELPDAKLTELRALGFFALGTWQDEVDPLEQPQYRADELDDLVRTTSQTFLGITLGCAARCHNHKFDPLTMTDYYSFVAILSPMKRPNQGRTDRDLPLGTSEQIAAEAQRDAAIGELQKQVAELEKAKPAGFEQQVGALREQQAALRQATPDLPRVYRLFEDSTEAPPTHLLLSGRASNPGPVMQPGVPAVLMHHPLTPGPSPARGEGSQSTQRRLALARWVASPENPLTARVIVNRVWQHHFGTGLVATSSDFGEKGARPTHPELLDWLAHWFMHDADWSLKKLHRLILTSRTYQQSTEIADWELRTADLSSGNPKSEIRNPQLIDPENHLLWHFPYRRLDVESIRDSMLAAAGNLDRRMYGPAVFLPIQAAAIEAHTDKQSAWQESPASEHGRRTVYAYVKRTLLVPMLETLDFCDTTNSTERRAVTSVAPQALTLFNGDFVNRQAEAFAQRLEREAGTNVSAQLNLAYRVALSRQPTEDERDAMLAFLKSETGAAGDAAGDSHAALVQLCRVILNLNEFVYPN